MRIERKVSGRELRRAYKQTATDLHAFTGAAAQDLTILQGDLRKTRELCADLSERLDKTARELVTARLEITKLAGIQLTFITQDWKSRAKWLVGR